MNKSAMQLRTYPGMPFAGLHRRRQLAAMMQLFLLYVLNKDQMLALGVLSVEF